MEMLNNKKRIKGVEFILWLDMDCDAPPNSLINSTMSLKVKTTKGKRIGVHSLVRSTSRVEGCDGAPRWGLG